MTSPTVPADAVLISLADIALALGVAVLAALVVCAPVVLFLLAITRAHLTARRTARRAQKEGTRP